MKDFMYYTPTKEYFGRDADKNIGEKLKEFQFTKLLSLRRGKRGKVRLIGRIEDDLRASA
jgi:alcohol dehydrogenase YqhD (iron-dependent ADH family)